jgi:hypothetical protein
MAVRGSSGEQVQTATPATGKCGGREIMRYLLTRRFVAAVLATAGIAGSLTLAMGQSQGPPPGGQTQGPPPGNSQLVPADGRSSPSDRTRKVRPAIPQDTAAPVQTPASPQPK